MNDLSPRARRFIARTRSGDDPCPADEHRVGRELERRIASGAVAVGIAASAAKAAGAATVGWGKALVWVTVGLGATVAALELRSGSPVTSPLPAVSTSAGEIARAVPSSRAEIERVDPAPVASANPRLRETPSAPRDQSSSVDPALPSSMAPPVARFDVLPEPVSSVASSDRLAAETAALRMAQQAMRSGRPAETLALLDQQDALYARGALAQERAAARVMALCQLGNVSAGRTAAQAFEQRWPRSPLLGRVRTACDAR